MKKPGLVRIDLDRPIVELVKRTDHRTLGIWAADCANRVLHYYEEKYPNDHRPRQSIETLQAWIKDGKFKMSVIREGSLSAHTAARSVKDADIVACFAARSAGQAVACAHVPSHALGAAVYAATAVRDATGSIEEADKERDWQYKHLLNLNKKSGVAKPAKQNLWRN